MDNVAIEVVVRINAGSNYSDNTIAASEMKLKGSMDAAAVPAELQRIMRAVEGEALRQIGISYEVKRLEDSRHLKLQEPPA
jgi:hypothetical protein